jgi:hypothetical protein
MGILPMIRGIHTGGTPVGLMGKMPMPRFKIAMKSRELVVALAMFLGCLSGCQKPMHFPAESMSDSANAAGAFAAYDAGGKGVADFYLFTDANGRINRLGFDSASQPNTKQYVDLDKLDKKNLHHLVIILDGFGYDVVKDYYDHGGLRVFYPPSRVIAPYPTLTDVCMEDALGFVPCAGFEADYYSHSQGREVGGAADYLKGVDEPYAQLLQYRASILLDPLSYVWPWAIYDKEINDVKKVFDQHKTHEMVAYFVSSAGEGTKYGAQGQRKCLERVDQLIHQIYWETRGQISVTMFADHGHSYTPGTRIPLEGFLTQHGWNLADTLKKPRDVVFIRFGLETYASFCTTERKELAEDLIQAQGVELASYAQDQSVIVLGKGGQKAVIDQRDGRYSYWPLQGDPLKLKGILSGLKSSKGPFYSEEDLFQATLMHEYPSALQRLWRAHFDLVKDPADVIVSLENKYFSGSKTLAAFAKVASTHGSLNRTNSTTFIMSTIAPLPPAMRSRDIPQHMQEITGEKFPSRK